MSAQRHHHICASAALAPTGVARLGGNTGAGNNKRAADSGVDAFLGLKPSSSAHRSGSGTAAAAAAGGGGGGAPRGQWSLDGIEQMLLQAAPQDLSEAVKPKKKLKKKSEK